MYNKISNNILVYDQELEFTKTLIQYCGKRIDVKICTEREELLKCNLNDYAIAFIVINDNRDLVDLVKIYNQIEQIYVNTNNIEIKRIVSKLHQVNFFCLNKDKIKIMNFIFNTIIGFEDSENIAIAV